MEEYKTIKVKVYEDLKSCHFLYYKQHNITKQNPNTDSVNKRTLFVSNIPPYFTEQCIRNVFGCFGKIEQVCLASKPTATPFSRNSIDSASNDLIRIYFNDKNGEEESKTFSHKIAYVLFSQAESVEKATKKSAEKERVLISKIGSNSSPKESLICTGMKKWIDEYKNRFVDAKKLKIEIDQYLKIFDEKKAEKEKEELEATNQPDEDGFITVTPKNRKANLRFTERNIEKIKSKEKKKRAQMQLVNFYSFQMKESKKEYISQLRKKFDEDKKRIESMKQARKFKPF